MTRRKYAWMLPPTSLKSRGGSSQTCFRLGISDRLTIVPLSVPCKPQLESSKTLSDFYHSDVVKPLLRSKEERQAGGKVMVNRRRSAVVVQMPAQSADIQSCHVQCALLSAVQFPVAIESNKPRTIHSEPISHSVYQGVHAGRSGVRCHQLYGRHVADLARL
ncbi:hypothetical protein BU16DRAFT_373017 [Lophium mytilinum]|uniref:Uncharacterized protein n=1 Tax=Lophium mytilinum TaxID=390894 RepID=A0A6A6QV33_9PEZI|nr:hypothetical protein BU16DRAFT_373017 [Lophium mytilinum]